jgi:hypothetical protein
LSVAVAVKVTELPWVTLTPAAGAEMVGVSGVELMQNGFTVLLVRVPQVVAVPVPEQLWDAVPIVVSWPVLPLGWHSAQEA